MLKGVCKYLLPLFAFVVLFLFFVTPTRAENVNYSVTITPSLNITIPTNTVTLDLSANSNPADTQGINVTVITNNPTGYKLTMTSQSGATDLVRNSTADGKADSIPTLTAEAGTTPASLETNTWGYRKNNTGNFIPYVSGAIVKETNAYTASDTTTLNFAAKIDYTKLTGAYSRTLTFTGVVNPLCNVTISGTMQDFNPCPDIAIGATGTLTDVRDGESYVVGKLDDGKFWMLDNLNLDLTNSTIVNALSPSNTNADTASLKSLKEGNRAAGANYATAGLALSNWGNTTYSFSQPQVNVSGNCSTGGSYPCSYTGAYTRNSITPRSESIGAGQHKIGVYYNYCAASAGSYCYGSDTTQGTSSGNATQDICPANWKIPSAGSDSEYEALCTAIKGSACGGSMSLAGTNPNSMLYKLSLVYSGNYGGSGITPPTTR